MALDTHDFERMRDDHYITSKYSRSFDKLLEDEQHHLIKQPEEDIIPPEKHNCDFIRDSYKKSMDSIINRCINYNILGKGSLKDALETAILSGTSCITVNGFAIEME